MTSRAPAPPSAATAGPDPRLLTMRMARSHDENFSVLSPLLPARLRQDFASVYAYCRSADDLADDPGTPAERLERLARWREDLERCFAGRPSHPVLVALQETVARHALDRQPFFDLLDAFEQDQRQTRYETWDDLCRYCERSANPVGRIVLQVCGHRDPVLAGLSDATCTALQLVNFWQDVRRDVLERDRIYLPREIAAGHGLDLDRLAARVREDAARDGRHDAGAKRPLADLLPAYRATLRALCDRTWPGFRRGRELWPRLARDVRPAIALFTLGGEAVMRAIERIGYATLERRPAISRWTKVRLYLRALAGCWVGVR